LIVFIETGEPLTSAQFAPFTKNAKTSLNELWTNSLYSSEAKTYWKTTVSPVGMKSNSRTAASSVVNPDSASRLASPAVRFAVVMPSSTFGPTTLTTSPELKMIPDSKPMMPVPPVNLPAATHAPVKVTFDTETPAPARSFARSVGVIPFRD